MNLPQIKENPLARIELASFASLEILCDFWIPSLFSKNKISENLIMYNIRIK